MASFPDKRVLFSLIPLPFAAHPPSTGRIRTWWIWEIWPRPSGTLPGLWVFDLRLHSSGPLPAYSPAEKDCRGRHCSSGSSPAPCCSLPWLRRRRPAHSEREAGKGPPRSGNRRLAPGHILSGRKNNCRGITRKSERFFPICTRKGPLETSPTPFLKSSFLSVAGFSTVER